MANDRYARSNTRNANADKLDFRGVNPATFPPAIAKEYDAMLAARSAFYEAKKRFETAFCTVKKLDPATTKFGYKSGVAFATGVTPTSGKAVSFDEA